jgi:Ca2+-binding RTX toxin-like protein
MTKVAQNPFDLGVGAHATTGNDYLFGTSGSDRLSGLNGNDVLFGRAGSDTLDGGAGTDTANYVEKSLALSVTLNGSSAAILTVGGVAEDTLLNIENLVGGFGADIFNGDANNNLFCGGVGRDTLDGGAGTDTASYAEKTGAVVVSLNGAGDALVTVGGSAEDTLRNIENVLGGKGNDVLTGDELANALRGGAGADTLGGGLAVDSLAGGLGHDLLTGGEGNDVFVFDHKPGSLDWDTLADFEGAGMPDGDVLQLSHAIFITLAAGSLSATAFQSGLDNVAHDAGTRIVYNQSSGELFYDADGSGSVAAIKLAVLANHPTALSADDFLIV